MNETHVNETARNEITGGRENRWTKTHGTENSQKETGT